MTILKLHFLDIVLCGTLSYLIYDVIDHSNDYSSCAKPINFWLLALYITLLLLRISTNIVINSDKICLIQAMRILLICCLIPFLIEWTIQGTIWYLEISDETPSCIPSDRLPALLIWWLFLCYLILVVLGGVFIYEIFDYLKKKRMKALIEAYLNSEMSQSDLEYLNSLIEGGDLNPEDIPLSKTELSQIPILCLQKYNELDYQCSICCEEFQLGEKIMRLIGCYHVFHQQCLEVWLKKKPLCPNCKRNIRNDLIIKMKNESFGKRDTSNFEEIADRRINLNLDNDLEERKI